MTIRITGDGPKITATGSGSTVLVEISTGQHDPGSFSGVHNDLTGRSTTGAHVGTAVSIDPTGFAGNLDGTIVNAQLLAAAVDDLTTGGGGGGVTGDSELVATSTTLTGPPHTVAVAAAGSIDITVTLPTATAADKGLVWYIRNLNSDSVVYVANLAEGDETITESKGLLVAGIETDTPGTYTWMKVGFVSETGTAGGGAALSDATPQALGVAAAGTGTAAARDDHVHAMPTASSITVDASGFNGNLTTSDDTVQEIAQKFDDLSIPAAGIADPGGANDDFLQRKSGAWTNRTVAQVKSDLGVGAPAPIAHFYEDDIYSGLQGLTHAQLGGGGTGVAYGKDLLYLWRIMVPQDVTVNGLLLMVQVDGGSGALARCGIYAQDSTTAPVGAPLVQSSDLNVNVTAGTLVSAAVTATALTAWTPYWGAMVLNSGTSQIRYMANGIVNTTRVGSLDAGQSSATAHTLRRAAHTFGALPTNPGATFTNAFSDIPGVLWKVQV